MLRAARSRLGAAPAARLASICSANAGRITSTTAACSARRTNRPRSESGGKSRTPCASIRGSSSSRRSMASCRSRRVLRFRQCDVVLDRPALGVLGVERLVQRDPERPQDRPLLERAGGDRIARSEQRVRVEVHGAGVDLDVPGVRQARADQRPHRVQALEDRRPVVGEVLVDGVEPAALRGGAVQLLHEHRRPRRRSCRRGS